MPDTRRRHAALNADIDRLVGQFEADLADVWGLVRKRILQLVNQLEAEKGRVISTQVNLGVARKVAQELQGALEEAGYGSLIQDALTEMGELAKYQGIGQTRVARVERQAAWSAETLDAFHDLKLRELLQVPDQVLRKVEQTLLRGIVGAQDRAELLNELLQELELTLPQVRTIYDTALSEFSRIAVTSTATGGDDEPFIYEGPIDGLTRPFCLERAGKVFSRAEIDAMDNGQLDNTLITGGGYNCRHTWIPVAVGGELAAFMDTGEYATPEYAEDARVAKEAQATLKAERRKKRGI
jgi:hypothetical protein